MHINPKTIVRQLAWVVGCTTGAVLFTLLIAMIVASLGDTIGY